MLHLYKKGIEKLKTYQLKHLNFRLMLWIFSLTILGINVIASSRPGEHFENKQIIGFALGLTIMIICALFDYKFVLKFYWLIYLFNFGLLIAVKIFGSTYLGAQRWLDFGSFLQIQPSELAKVFLALFFAEFLNRHKDKINSVKIILASGILLVIPVFFIYKQPDLSTSVVIIIMFLFIMYIAGISYKIILGFIGIMIPLAVLFVYLLMQPNQSVLEDYQYKRLVGFYDEDNEEAQALRYQQTNSEMAIGSGGLWGKGLNNTSEDSVKNGNYIPEPQTDFIFAIVGEELGFVGTTSVIVLLCLVVFECFYTGAHAPDLAGRLLCCGIGSYIAIQSFVNIGVVTNMIPNTGLPLPFVSYGLSSLLSLFIAMGFVLNVSLQHKKLLQ